MMAPVVPSVVRILIMPVAIVNGNLRFRCIAVVHVIAAAVVLTAIEILWIVNVRIVVESRVVAVAGCSTPASTISLLRLLRVRYRSGRNAGNQGQGDNHQRLTNHNSPPRTLAYLKSPVHVHPCD